MRLTDANEIAEELYGLRQETRCTHEPFLAGKSDAYWDAHGMVIEARTIDAIPVAWLKKLCDSYDYNLFYSIPLKQVLKSWEIEKHLQNERKDSE